MMNPETTALRLASAITQQAADEGWPYLCLSPFHKGSGNLREGFEILALLTTIPDEVALLKRPVIIELRGTNITDLRPLQRVPKISGIRFDGIPACDNDKELFEIAAKIADDPKVVLFQRWLDRQERYDPPEPREGGPQFEIGESAPIRMIDSFLDDGKDGDQEFLKMECQRKAEELRQIAELAANVAPNLPRTVELYCDMISQTSPEIGARSIWSIANSLEAVLQVHQLSLSQHAHSNELPTAVASSLSDLTDTHRVWFLGHPGAREVFERAAKHSKPEPHSDVYKVIEAVVEAADKSEDVDSNATFAAKQNLKIAGTNTPASIAAFGEVEDWAWNFVASLVRKCWTMVNANPLGPIPTGIGLYFLLNFIAVNEPALRDFAINVMSQGPIWWDALCAAARKHVSLIRGDSEK